jgi:hypothetical protein
MMSRLYGYLGAFAAFVLTVFGAFFLGKRDGVKSEEINDLEDEVELHETYEEIDTSPDAVDPLSKLR